MKILFEEHHYVRHSLPDSIRALDESLFNQLTDAVKVDCVGYYFDAKLNDCVLILPKVLIREEKDAEGRSVEKVLGKYTPEQVLDFTSRESVKAGAVRDMNLPRETVKFLREFAVWIYRAVRVYRNQVEDSDNIVSSRLMSTANTRAKVESNNFLDILLELAKFNRENLDFFNRVLHNTHSGYNKINWTKTISKSKVVFQDGEPVYTNPFNRKWQVNYEEELLVIFFSILQYCNEAYGFNNELRYGFKLMSPRTIERWIESGKGARTLKKIRNKYFSDTAIRIWELCSAFFDHLKSIKVCGGREMLVVKKFDRIFEAMIDDLLSDRDLAELKNQGNDCKDRRLDHIYRDLALTAHGTYEKSLYIGDSKYYPIDALIPDSDIVKQFTYARNLIQYGIDIFSTDEPRRVAERKRLQIPRFRDNITEGYNIVPNFFLSAFVEAKDGVVKRDAVDIKPRKDGVKNIFHSRCHFDNRLFDRDTLIVCHFDVNFLFVISMYARQKDGEKSAWRRKVRALFRAAIQEELHDRYDFYALKAVGNPLAGEKFLIEHYRDLQGQLCRPFRDDTLYAMAFAKSNDPNGNGANKAKLEDLRELMKGYFVVSEFRLGEDPLSTCCGTSELQRLAQDYQAAVSIGGRSVDDEATLPRYHLARYADENFLIGSYHDSAHWKWITGDNDRGTLIYNVRIKSKNTSETRAGSRTETWWRKQKIKFVFLFEEGHESENQYRVYRVHDYAVMTQERMEKSKYPRPAKGDYFIFRFDEEVKFDPLDLGALVSEIQTGRNEAEKYAPIVKTGSELIVKILT